ncbi:MAG: hypothetical protein HYV07_19235 [Deltaproteobacteria bacterium]|nr:hypothetical protein [Deltaproteobacteria bacterium]
MPSTAGTLLELGSDELAFVVTEREGTFDVGRVLTERSTPEPLATASGVWVYSTRASELEASFPYAVPVLEELTVTLDIAPRCSNGRVDRDRVLVPFPKSGRVQAWASSGALVPADPPPVTAFVAARWSDAKCPELVGAFQPFGMRSRVLEPGELIDGLTHPGDELEKWINLRGVNPLDGETVFASSRKALFRFRRDEAFQDLATHRALLRELFSLDPRLETITGLELEVIVGFLPNGNALVHLRGLVEIEALAELSVGEELRWVRTVTIAEGMVQPRLFEGELYWWAPSNIVHGPAEGPFSRISTPRASVEVFEVTGDPSYPFILAAGSAVERLQSQIWIGDFAGSTPQPVGLGVASGIRSVVWEDDEEGFVVYVATHSDLLEVRPNGSVAKVEVHLSPDDAGHCTRRDECGLARRVASDQGGLASIPNQRGAFIFKERCFTPFVVRPGGCSRSISAGAVDPFELKALTVSSDRVWVVGLGALAYAEIK